MNLTPERREEQQFCAELQTAPQQKGAPAGQMNEEEVGNPGALPPTSDGHIDGVVPATLEALERCESESDSHIDGVVLSEADISRGTRAEEELRRSEERSQLAMDAGRIYSWELNPQTRHLDRSHNSEAVIGFPLPGDIDGTFDLIHPDDRQKTVAAIGAMLGGGEPFDAEFRMVNPANGEAFWFHSQGARRPGPRDGQARFVGITQNITERRAAEESLRLRASEEWLRSILAGARDTAIFTFDSGRRIQSWNPAAQTIFGFSEGEIIGQQLDKLFVAQDRRDRVPQDEVAQAAREGHAECERWHERKDGSRFLGSGSVTPLRGAAGQIIGFVSILRDLTQERRIQEQLRRGAEADAFRLQLSDALRLLHDPAQIQAQACRLLGEHLGVDRAFYVEVSEAEGVARVEQSFNRGDSPFLVGTFQVADFGWTLPFYERSEILVVADARTSDLVPDADRAALESVCIGAHISVPLVKAGTLVGALCVTEPGPREWSESEVELVRGTSERIWDAVTRARAEAALRESEGRYRLVVESVTEYAIITLDINGLITSWNPGAERAFGWTSAEAIGQNTAIIFTPEDLATGESEKEMREARSAGRAADERWHLRRDGSRLFLSGVLSPLREGGLDGFVKIARDLTREREIEAAVRQSEERLRTVVSNTPIVQFAVDSDGVFTLSEGSGLSTLDLTAGQVVGRSVFEVYANTPQIGENVRRSLAGEAFNVVQLVGDLAFDTSFAPLRDESGRIVGATGVALDVTGRERTLAALRESAAQFHTLSDAVPQIIWTNEAGGVANYFNSRWFEYSGLSLDDSFGPGWQAIVHPDDEPFSKQAWQRALERGEVFDTEYRLRRGDGVYRWFIGRNVPLRDGQRVTGWFGTATDINDLKEAEATLLENGERFRAMFEQGTAGVAEYDLNGRHIFVNGMFCESLGFSRDELLGKELRDITHPEDWPHCHDLFERAKIEGDSCLNEKRLVCKNGEIIWIADSVSGIRDEDGQTQSVVAVSIDITQRKLAEEELQRTHDELETRVDLRTGELARALGQVRAEVEQRRGAEAGRAELMKRLVNTQEEERGRISRELHDNLGQHLTAVMLGLQALETQMETFSGGKRGQSAPRLDKLRELVDGLMRAAHRQAWELRPAELDAMGLESTLDQYSRDWSGRTGIEVDFQATGWDRRPASEVETTLYRVVQEALTNVARHADASLVSVVIERSDNSASVIIEDDGQGFDTEQSTGRLGLLGMQERLSIVNGTLDIESIPGEGTTVFARVPL